MATTAVLRLYWLCSSVFSSCVHICRFQREFKANWSADVLDCQDNLDGCKDARVPEWMLPDLENDL